MKTISLETNTYDSGKGLIPNHQFGFRKHIILEQIRKIVNEISLVFEYCSAVFPNMSQAFDKVWYDSLLCKIPFTNTNTNTISIPIPFHQYQYYLPKKFYVILKSYFSEK
jgi:hypothetical protein